MTTPTQSKVDSASLIINILRHHFQIFKFGSISTGKCRKLNVSLKSRMIFPLFAKASSDNAKEKTAYRIRNIAMTKPTNFTETKENRQ